MHGKEASIATKELYRVLWVTIVQVRRDHKGILTISNYSDPYSILRSSEKKKKPKKTQQNPKNLKPLDPFGGHSRYTSPELNPKP